MQGSKRTAIFGVLVLVVATVAIPYVSRQYKAEFDRGSRPQNAD
jgi:hypothetical protein